MAKPQPIELPLVCRLRAELEGIEPAIWRELLLYGDLSLAGLHLVLQVAFGWDDDHQHEWKVGGKSIRAGARKGADDEEIVTVAEALPRMGSTLRYRYDFGDDWCVKVSVLERRDLTPFDRLAGVARLLGAGRAAPPEDCGGVSAYLDLLDASADPKHPRREEILEPWEGGPFDGEALDIEALEEAVVRLGGPELGEEDEDEDGEAIVLGDPEEDDLDLMDERTARAFASEFPYDADTDAHLAGWLELDEMERTGTIEACHQLRNHPVGQNARLHAVAHAVVENQLAGGNPPATRETLQRLRAAGVSRHQAVHAIGNVVVEAMQTILTTRQPADLKAIEKQLRALRPADWR